MGQKSVEKKDGRVRQAPCIQQMGKKVDLLGLLTPCQVYMSIALEGKLP